MMRFSDVQAEEETIQHSALDHLQPDATVQPRAIGGAVIEVAHASTGQTRLARLRQSGALKIICPTVFRPDMEGVVVNTAGGMHKMKSLRRCAIKSMWVKVRG